MKKVLVYLILFASISMTMLSCYSPILSQLEMNGEIKIVGAIYDMDNGQVSFFN